MKKEILHFIFEDSNKKEQFKINLNSILEIIECLINEKKLKKLPDNLISELKKNYSYNEKSNKVEFTLEEIDSFDYENERKYLLKSQQEEKEYEKYINRKDS